MKLPAKVAVMFLWLGGTTLLIIGGFSYSSLRKQTIEAFDQRQFVLASQTLLAIDRLLYERYQDINEMTSGEIHTALTDLENHDLLDIEERLFDLKKHSGPWDLISIVDDQAKVFVSTDDNLVGKNIATDNPSFKAYQAALEGEIYYSDALVSQETGRVTVIFAALFRDKPWVNISRRVLIAQFSLPSATELLDIPISKSYLFNSQGTLISTTDPANQEKEFVFDIGHDSNMKTDHSVKFHTSVGFFNQEKSFHTSISEAGYLNYEGNNWMLVLETPQSVVLKEVNGSFLGLLALMIPIAIVTIAITMTVAMKVVVVPITDLTAYIEEIAIKKLDLSSFDLKMFQSERGDEIGTLWKKFGEMIVRVKDSTNRVVEQVKITKKEHARLMASIADLPLGFILVNAQGKVELSNKAIKKIFDLKEPLSDYQQIQDIIGNNLDLNKFRKQSRENKKSYLIKETKFGREQYLRIFVVPVILDEGSKEIIDNVVIFEDITEEKLLSKTRDEFFAVASHELRTPLTSIRGNASLIMEHFGDKIKNKDMKSMLEDIYASSMRLISIVEDFLDVSKIDQGRIKYSLESFDILALIKESARELKGTFSSKGLTLNIKKESSTPFLVKADKNRTKQVIVNFLSNASKFTKKGGVEIKVVGDENKVKVSFIDSGIGIAPENQKMLFRKFVQTGSNHLTRDATQGTGLGLYISKMLIKGMGGEIALESSQLNEGSTFVFNLPAAKSVENTIKQKL